jgi:hypothetical protein
VKKDNPTAKPHIRRKAHNFNFMPEDVVWVCSMGEGKLVGRSYTPRKAWEIWNKLVGSYERG